MDQEQQKALAGYLVFCAVLGYFGHNNLAMKERKRLEAMQKDIAELKIKKTNFLSAKKKAAEDTSKLTQVKSDLNAILERFPTPKGRQGERQMKVYDTFAISEQVSAAAHGLVLNPKEAFDPDHFLYQSEHVQEDDLAGKAGGWTDGKPKPTVSAYQCPKCGHMQSADMQSTGCPVCGAQFSATDEAGAQKHSEIPAKIFNTLAVDQVRFNYKISGDYRSFVQFLEDLNQQKYYLDATTVDVALRGPSGSDIAATVTVSALDLGDGLVNSVVP